MADERAVTPIDVITLYGRYSGSVVTRGYRLSDILSDQNSAVLDMWETLTTLAGDSSREVRWKEVVLRKNDILMVIPKGNHEAPIRRRNYHQKKHRYGAMIALPGCILSGIVHLSARATAVSVLDQNSPFPAFIGVTDVTIHGSTHGLLPPQCNVAIIRRQAIESIQLTAAPLPSLQTTPKQETSLVPDVGSELE